MRQSMGLENRDQILRDLETLVLEKYIEEIVSASSEGCLRCKSDKDAWAAVEVRTGGAWCNQALSLWHDR